MAAIFGFGGAPTFFLVLCWPRMAKDLLQVVSVTTFMATLCFHFVHVLSCSIFTFFWYSCDNTNARHHERSSGRQ